MAWKIATNSAFSGWDACRSGYVTPTFMNHALYTYFVLQRLNHTIMYNVHYK